MDCLDLVIDYLISQGIASKRDVDIFKDFAPDDPINCFSIYEYAGTSVTPFSALSVRSIQVTYRSNSSILARTKCWNAFRALYKEDSIIYFGTQIALITIRNTPIKIGVDKNNNVVYAFNLGITISNNLVVPK